MLDALAELKSDDNKGAPKADGTPLPLAPTGAATAPAPPTPPAP
jgi:hypothetical protein